MNDTPLVPGPWNEVEIKEPWAKEKAAFKRGIKIQFKYPLWKNWINCEVPLWLPHVEYRIAEAANTHLAGSYMQFETIPVVAENIRDTLRATLR